MKKPAKIKKSADIRKAPAAKIFDFKKVKKVTPAEERQFKILERKREDLQKPLKPESKAYLKRKADKAAIAPLDKKLKAALKKFGGRGIKISQFHSEYYTARGAEALLALGTKPKSSYGGEKKIRQKLNFYNLKNGRYLIERDGKPDDKTYTWPQVERLQRKQNRDKKVAAIANRIGASPAEVRAIIKKIEAQERANVKKYKRSKAFKKLSWKKRRKITIQRRVNAIFGAMTDLLEIYGSPKALKEDSQGGQWKKFNGTWAVKEGKAWFEKIGPDEWRQLRIRKSYRRKKK